MPTLYLTNKAIKSYKYNGKPISYNDKKVNGLTLIVHKTKKSFVFRYRHKGKQTKKKIGEYRIITLKEAREKAIAYKKKLIDGIDPSSTKGAKREPTMNDIYENYLEYHLKEKKETTYKVNKSVIEKHIIPIFGNRNIHEIEVYEITEMLQEKNKNQSQHSVIKIRSLLNALFAHGRKLSSVKYDNPVIDAWNVNKDKKPKNRAYGKNEIKQIFKHLNLTTQPFKDLVQILFYTGKRKTETLKMTWDQLNLEKQIWIIPEENTKNNRGDKVYLCDTIINDVLVRRLNNKKSKYVLHSNWQSKYDTYPTTFKPMIKLIREKTGVSDFKFHGLRRTIATNLAEKEIQPHIIDRVLNNASAGEYSRIREIYNKYDYWKEKIDALKIYEKYLNNIRLDK